MENPFLGRFSVNSMDLPGVLTFYALEQELAIGRNFGAPNHFMRMKCGETSIMFYPRDPSIDSLELFPDGTLIISKGRSFDEAHQAITLMTNGNAKLYASVPISVNDISSEICGVVLEVEGKSVNAMLYWGQYYLNEKGMNWLVNRAIKLNQSLRRARYKSRRLKELNVILLHLDDKVGLCDTVDCPLPLTAPLKVEQEELLRYYFLPSEKLRKTDAMHEIALSYRCDGRKSSEDTSLIWSTRKGIYALRPSASLHVSRLLGFIPSELEEASVDKFELCLNEQVKAEGYTNLKATIKAFYRAKRALDMYREATWAPTLRLVELSARLKNIGDEIALELPT